MSAAAMNARPAGQAAVYGNNARVLAGAQERGNVSPHSPQAPRRTPLSLVAGAPARRRVPFALFCFAVLVAALGAFFRQEGLFTFVRWNYFFTNPPLSITEAELREGFAIIDRGLTIADRAVD